MVFVFLSLITFIFYGVIRGKRASQNLSIILLIIYAIVFSMRALEVADTEPYYDIYYGYIDPNMEIGYLFLNDFFRHWKLEFHYFLLIIAVFDLCLWAYFTQKTLCQKNLLMPLALFMSNMGMIYYGIVLRSGMASSIMMIPIYKMMVSYNQSQEIIYSLPRRIIDNMKMIILFFVCIFFAGLFHQSVYVVIFALLLYYMPLTKKNQYIILFLALFLSAIPSIPQFISANVQPLLEKFDLRMSGRFDGEVIHGLSWYQIINVLFGFIYIRLSDTCRSTSLQKQYQFILNLYIIGVFMSEAFSFLTAGARIGHLLIFYEFFLPALLLKEELSFRRRKKILTIFLFMIVLNLARNLYGTPSLINYLG